MYNGVEVGRGAREDKKSYLDDLSRKGVMADVVLATDPVP